MTEEFDPLTKPMDATSIHKGASNMSDHRAFIDMNGGYQSEREGIAKEAHDAWVVSNTWGLTRDDFIRLSYFHGCMDDGSDGLGPRNGENDKNGDVVYKGDTGSALTRSMVSDWLSDSNSFTHGYGKAAKKADAALQAKAAEIARLRAENEALWADAERWCKFEKMLRQPMTPSHCAIRVVEVSPMYGDEKPIGDLRKFVDAARGTT